MKIPSPETPIQVDPVTFYIRFLVHVASTHEETNRMLAPEPNAVFFGLDVSATRTMISCGGDNVVNRSQGLMRLCCHRPAAKHVFVCRNEYRCAPPYMINKSPSFREQTPVCRDASHTADEQNY
jgi:hypothetical protein